MINRYMVVLSHGDRSGIIQAFGPYDSEEEAEHARGVIPEVLPAVSAGLWETVLCTNLETEGPI